MVSGEQLQRQQKQSQVHERDQLQHEFSNIPSQHQRSVAGQSDSNGNSQPGQNNNNNNSNAGNGSNSGAAGGGLVGGGTSAAAAKNQLEQLNTMREALFSQDGWGCQHVNQDTNWEVPSSPEPTNKDPSGGPPIWKPNINNGTDLWESNLRNGGQPPPQPVQKTPWGHTPSTNLGGTWGEDDDGTDTSNVWTGAPANSTGPQWGQSSGGPGAGGSANVGGATANAWGDPRDMRPCPIDIRNVDPRELRTPSSGDPRDIRGMIDPRDPIRGDPRGISGRLNGTSEMWGQHHPIAAHGQIPLNKMVGTAAAAVAAVATGAGTNTQWGAAQPVVGPKEMTAVIGAGAGNTGIVSGPVGGSKQATGWEEPSPPPQRRNIPNYDDGTSLWGQQSRVPGGSSHWKDMSDPMTRSHLIRGAIGNPNVGGGNGGGGNAGVSNSVGVSGPVTGNSGSTNSAPMGGGGVPQGRMGGGPAVGGQLKPDNTMWVHPAVAAAAVAASAAVVGVSSTRNNGAWGDDHNSGSGANWGDDKSAGMGNLTGAGVGGASWNDSTAAAAWNKNQNKISVASGGVGQGGWGDANDLTNEWGAHNIAKPQAKLVGMNSDMIKGSKQYRMLVETGFKKEDVERALIQTNLNVEEAAEILNSRVNAIESWRRHDETMATLGGFDHSNAGGFPGRFPSANAQQTMPFAPVRNNNLLNNMGGSNVGGNPSLAALNNIQPLQVQKYLNQGGPHNVGGAQSAAAVAAFGPNAAAAAAAAAAHNSGQPTAQQLRMLVQQIQLAVQSGYLSSQILNQPLAPATLVLLNQLLSNIKHLQGAQASLGRGNNANAMQINVTVAKYKQQITNLQNQINAQQAVYVKQQQPQQQSQQPHPAATHVTTANVEYMRGQHDAISALQGNFSEINLNKPGGYQGASNQQSRLNQWKLPVLDKDGTTDSTDFSRAPGATAKPSLSSSSANNMGSLGLQGDGTWSTGRNIGDGWPDSTNDNENKDWPVAQPSTATAFTDLVPEFEPGKPWKLNFPTNLTELLKQVNATEQEQYGSQIKSIEDDPSITPGSVARSPLSINPTPKEADIFANTSKNSPTDLPPLSLSSSTWSFNPSTNNQNFPSWSDNVSQQCTTSSELWAAPINKTSRGPPPGLGTNKASAGGVNVSAASVTNPSVVTGSSNGWIGSGITGRVPSANANWSTTNSSWNSNWLLLKNLTTQIDGSTLRTLCMQHGPLINFHLYLNQGIALCKYATREEANKAQMTLNNCVLGNTTICAESPNETEVQSILQHLPPSVGQSSGPVGGSASGNTGGVNPGIVGGGNSVSSNVASGGGGGGGGGNNGGPNGPGNNNGNNPGVGGTGAGGVSTNNAQNSGTTTGGAGGSVGGNAGNSAWRQQNSQNQSRPTGTDAWGSGSVWQTTNTTANLWTSLDGTTERGTPSNLKSYLPENLLELN